MVEQIKINQKKSLKDTVKELLLNNMVTILFAIVGYMGFRLSGLSLPFFLNDLISRVARNGFLVLALIIPVLAGMGLNFAIVIGAMAGQMAIVMVVHWGFVSWQGILLAALISTPLALLFGFLTGKLLNKTKGQEMITSLILGFFANGFYQFIFLILVGSVIPMKNEALIISSGVGLRVTIDLAENLRYGLDDVWRMGFHYTLIYGGGIFALTQVFRLIRNWKSPKVNYNKAKNIAYIALPLLAVAWGLAILNSQALFSNSLLISRSKMLMNIKVPVVTMIVIGALCVFTMFISKTKLGQDFRTVGQDRHIAEISGINADRIRLTAIILSTVLAAWGQIIFLQNLGTMSTYGSHEQVGMFAIAALLIGGASVTKATIGQALLGTVLFHTLFIVSPLAGRNLFGDAQLGEFFRAFVAYGIIGMSLGMHAWKKQLQARNRL